MNKPNWRDSHGGYCQWPYCAEIGEVHYEYRATEWIDKRSGVDLCDEHVSEMILELGFTPVGPKIGEQVWLSAFEDYPREQVYVRDWLLFDGRVVVLVSDSNDTPLDDCEEVDLEMIES